MTGIIVKPGLRVVDVGMNRVKIKATCQRRYQDVICQEKMLMNSQRFVRTLQ